jgi:hypothetical protein
MPPAHAGAIAGYGANNLRRRKSSSNKRFPQPAPVPETRLNALKSLAPRRRAQDDDIYLKSGVAVSRPAGLDSSNPSLQG